MRWTAEDFANATGVFRREMAGALRRMTVGIASGGIWQLLGHVLFDVTSRETRQLEVFHGIGFFARPPSNSSSAEAIAAQVGGPNGQVVIATRDEATRELVDDIADDESAQHNSTCRVQCKADGTIEARTHGGTAHALATLADLQALSDAIHGWAPVANDGGAALHVAIETLRGTGWPHGTSKLKGE